jgi:hypothetical protein
VIVRTQKATQKVGLTLSAMACLCRIPTPPSCHYETVVTIWIVHEGVDCGDEAEAVMGVLGSAVCTWVEG